MDTKSKSNLRKSVGQKMCDLITKNEEQEFDEEENLAKDKLL
jgi:hypothetical protein